MRHVSISYIAGLFDGEGSIGAYKRDSPKSWAFHFVIINTHKEALEAVQAVIGGRLYETRRIDVRHKRCWRLVIGGRLQVRAVLKRLLPHLIIKREKALEMLRKAEDPVKEERLCRLEDCQRIHLARGFCSMHYQRVRLGLMFPSDY